MQDRRTDSIAKELNDFINEILDEAIKNTNDSIP